VRGYIANFKSSHVFLIMDSCFSGDMLDTERGMPETGGADYFKKAYKRTARQVLTSGASEAVPDRSELAMLLVHALQKNTSPFIDPLMLYNEVRLGMTATTPLFGYLRSTGHQAGASFILFRKQETKSNAVQTKEEEPAMIIARTENKEKKAEANQAAATTEKNDYVNSGMIYVQAGRFVMGAKDGVDHERPTHEVELAGFSIARHETTFVEYDAFCDATVGTKPGDEGWGRGERPVINVCWLDAVEYCNWLSKKERLEPCYSISGGSVSCNFKANGYRLPTEAEWEYASRAGIKNEQTKYSGSDEVDTVAWYNKNAKKKTSDVGKKKPNGLGLYDMSGNAWEWCWDFFGSNYYATSQATDPAGPATGDSRVLRGGSWYNGSSYERVTTRGNAKADARDNTFGFRVVRSGK
jgi:formylglycine-generating enzyme required for sulfatase activity